MEKKKLLFLVNPHAGKSEIKGKALDVIDLFIRNGYEVVVHTTQRQLEVSKFVAEQACGYNHVVACGGDGTLNEVVSGLMACEKRPTLGYIPAGTVNDFASSLGLSKNILQAAQTAVCGKRFSCDIGAFNDRYFTYIAAFGAFTDVSYQTSQPAKNLLGRVAYILEGITRLPAIKAYHMKVLHDGQTVEGDFLFGMVSNSRSVGGFPLTGNLDISMNDGLLEVLLVRNPQNAIQAQQLLNSILRKEFDSEFIIGFHTQTLEVEAPDPVPWTLDGEFGGDIKTANIQNCHKAIEILTAAQ